MQQSYEGAAALAHDRSGPAEVTLCSYICIITSTKAGSMCDRTAGSIATELDVELGVDPRTCGVAPVLR